MISRRVLKKNQAKCIRPRLETGSNCSIRREATTVMPMQPFPVRGHACSVASLIGILQSEQNLAFFAVLPQGNVLKSASELLMRCAPHVPVTPMPRPIPSFKTAEAGPGPTTTD